MSEAEVKEVSCKNCSEKVPLGNFCLKCGKAINTEPMDGRINEPRPPVQASDASLSTASGSDTVTLNGQNSGTSVPPANNTAGSYQNNTANLANNCSSSNTESSSYANAVKSSQKNGKQNQFTSL